ncbi:HAMP domain-containing sensor histidine kinase [Myceligenerans crystallogenes]|uniref:histidine kinase n=1 Tax=Myceligenerans crystallogenes TaxID=316335 RepID=A0ABP4ZJ63_9MICO
MSGVVTADVTPVDTGAPADARTPADSGTPVKSRLHAWIAAIPLRTRLVAITAFLLAVGLIVAGLLTRAVTERYLIDQVDAELRANAPGLAKVVLSWGAAGALPSDYYIEYRWEDSSTAGDESENGHTTVRRGLETVQAFGLPDIPGLTYEEAAARAHDPFTVRAVTVGESASATRWRVYPMVNASPTSGAPQIAVVALPLGRVDATLDVLTKTLVLSGLGIVLLGLVLAGLMIERSLRQLREIEGSAADIAAGDLSQRVPAPPPSTEVGSLAASLNSMLAQIETAFSAREASEARMRRFVADASHELRTPLATIRGYGELYRMGALNDAAGNPDTERVTDTMTRVEDAARRMGSLVNDLLALARLDEGRPIAQAPVDVVALARDSAQDLRALDPSRQVRVVGLGTMPDDDAAAGLDPVTAHGDVERLRQVLTNLIGNVARHTPAGTPAEIAVGHGAGGEVVVEVRDHGPGVDDELAVRMFERFYRADSSRNRESGGSGLGLAIVSAIVDAHRGEIEVVQTPGGGLTVRVTLPPGAAA